MSEYEPDSKIKWRAGEKNSARKHNLSVDLSLAAGQLLPGGDIESIQGRRGRSLSVPKVERPQRPIFLVWDQGPNAEADFADHRYWMILAYVVGSSGDKGTEIPKLYEAKPSTDMRKHYIIAATNLSERPAGVNGDVTAGTHSLQKGTAIAGLWGEFDQTNGTPVMRYYFQSGGAGGGEAIGADQFTVHQMGAANEDVWDLIMFSPTV